MIQKILLSLFVSVAGTVALTFAAQANVPCTQVSNPTPGVQCYQRVKVESRHVGYGDGTSRGESSSTSIAGWYITSWNGPVSTNSNNGSANLEFIQRESDFQIGSTLDEYDKQLLKSRDQVQSYAKFPISGVPITVGGLTEKINNALQENQRRRDYFSQARTNVDRIVIRSEASGRCTKNVLGTCVDNAGGWYRGYVDVYMVYVGSPDEIASIRQRTINEIQQGLQQLQQASNNNSSSSSIGTGKGTESNSDINFCNKTSDKTIFGVYASYDSPNGWTSHGWYKVEPGNCRKISIGRAYNGDIFVYAEYNSGSTFWGGQDASFCINKTESFTIPNSDVNCSGDQFKRVGMSKFSIRSGINTWDYNP